MLGRRWAATTGTPSITTLPQGTWAPWTATIGTTATPGSGRAWAAWSASNEDRPQCGGEGMAAMPQPPNGVELQPAAILLGVDHEHPTGADHQVIKVGGRALDGQVVQDRPPLSLEGGQQPGGAPLP